MPVVCISVNFFLLFYFFLANNMGILSSDNVDRLRINSYRVKRAMCKTATISSVFEDHVVQKDVFKPAELIFNVQMVMLPY